MEEKKNELVNDCGFRDVAPIMVDLPYPPLQVTKKNQGYADILSNDYAGAVSEMTAITQYINNQNRLSAEKCPLAKTILGIAMAEMIHMRKLGEMIFLLGGVVDFVARQRNGKQNLWTPQYLKLPNHAREMILADIEGEKATINQYRIHMKMINDSCVTAVLARIVQDEEYHIMLLQTLLRELRSEK